MLHLCFWIDDYDLSITAKSFHSTSNNGGIYERHMRVELMWNISTDKMIFQNKEIQMKANYLLFVIFLTILLAGCAGVDSRYTYDTHADFSPPKSYSWKPGTRDSFTTPEHGDYVINKVNQNLAAKGFTLTEENPDFLIRIPDIDRFTEEYQTLHGGIQTYQAVMLIEMVDSKTKELLWQGVGRGQYTEAYTPEEILKSIETVTEELLNKFPPPVK